MRAVVQRVGRAAVHIDDAGSSYVSGSIDRGLLVLLGVHVDDAAAPQAAADWLAAKIAHLRIFPDEDGRMNRSVLDLGLGVLVVSQFTLYGDCRKGRRPNFMAAAPPDVAEPAYEAFCEALLGLGLSPVQRGMFGAAMRVDSGQ